MKGPLSALFALSHIWLSAQTQALNNLNNLYVHPKGEMGIHIDFFNNGEFVAKDSSLIGFYGTFPNTVMGAAPISLYDVEFGNEIGTVLHQRINVANNANFVLGNVFTPHRVEANVLNFEPPGFYTGDSDDTKVIGYVGMLGQEGFTFPVGDPSQLRPLILNSPPSEELSICTYIREDPDNTTAVNKTFDANAKTRDVGEVSNSEFWILKNNGEATVTLSWNAQSNLVGLAPDLSGIILVGWNIFANKWIPISGTNGIGTMTEGIITSNPFQPNKFAAITFAGTPVQNDIFAVNNPTLDNYYISPNGDGVNDVLVFDEIRDAGGNFVHIYNKFGQKVFEMTNYTNEFNGVSNVNNAVIMRDIGLPEGIYYYIVDLVEENLQYQGFFFLDR